MTRLNKACGDTMWYRLPLGMLRSGPETRQRWAMPRLPDEIRGAALGKRSRNGSPSGASVLAALYTTDVRQDVGNLHRDSEGEAACQSY